MKPLLSSLLLTTAVALFGGAASAETADRNKPMNVESDALRYDDQRQTSVFTGRVVLTKGSILIRGAKLDVRQDSDGFQLGLVTAEPGKRAFFRQKREGLDEFIEGEGEVIEYDSRADTVKFIGQGQLRRYRGANLSDEFTGGVIVYNNSTDVFTIDGAPTKSGAAVVPAGRVRAVLIPAPAPEAGVKPGVNPNPPLRATPQLQEGRQ